jgi:hypothetical protein
MERENRSNGNQEESCKEKEKALTSTTVEKPKGRESVP